MDSMRKLLSPSNAPAACPKRRLLAVVAVLLCGLQTSFGGASPGDVVIIVNKANKVDSLSAKELKQIFSGEKGKWPDGGKIQTIAPSQAEAGHKTAIQFLFGMTEADYQKYTIHATFVGNTQQVPRDSGSSKAVVGLVGLVPGSIAFVRADVVNDTVKAIKVDGIAPGADGYPLAAK